MKIAVSVGDVNGIGIEAFFKSMDLLKFEDVEFTIFTNPAVLSTYCKLAGIDCRQSGEKFIYNNRYLGIIALETRVNVVFGKNSRDAGEHAANSIKAALEKTMAGEFDALLTLPISKDAIKKAGWQHPGHTEMLAEKCGVERPLMILCTKKYRVGLITIHEPLSKVPELITKDLIFEIGEKFHNSLLDDFGIKNPKIALLGLNPHAGEEGRIGSEELEIIIPAKNYLNEHGYNFEGPFPADGFFARGQKDEYDGIIAMYHDQGLIPLKMLAGAGGVNMTAGLPVIRTSPDHGTAFAIAGKGLADGQSTLEAIELAREIHMRRSRKNGI
jgi:4-hydroxythreonine-4-phosphate dehydrogenase